MLPAIWWVEAATLLWSLHGEALSTIIETAHAHCNHCPANNDPKTASTTMQNITIRLFGGLTQAKRAGLAHRQRYDTFINLGSTPVRAGL